MSIIERAMRRIHWCVIECITPPCWFAAPSFPASALLTTQIGIWLFIWHWDLCGETLAGDSPSSIHFNSWLPSYMGCIHSA